jgi:hypothetical protein
MECYMMSRGRAQALAEALRKMHPKQRKRIDADAVRIFCISSAEAERDPTDPEWLEHGPLDEVTAWIDIEQLLR